VSSVIFLAAARAWSTDLTSSLFYFAGRPAVAFEVCLVCSPVRLPAASIASGVAPVGE
jgi:hypothetical protein